jgi:hypothetical protein
MTKIKTNKIKISKSLKPLKNRLSLNKSDPKLYVDVNIGKQGMERIIVYEGDTAEGLSREFC